MDDTVVIKVEPEWCQVSEDAPESILPNADTEAFINLEHDQVGGIDHIGQSKAAVAFNLAQELLQLKQEIMQEPNFVSDDLAVQPLNASNPSGADPLQPLAALELSGPKQEVMFVEVKQEPLEEEDISLEVSPLENDLGVIQSSDNCSSSWVQHGEEIVKLERADSTEHVIDALEFVEIVSRNNETTWQGNMNSNDGASGSGKQNSSENVPLRTLRKRQEDMQCIALSSHHDNLSHVHNPEKPWACKHCHMRFKTRHKLLRHGNVHTGIKEYECDLCDKKYTTAGILRIHMQKHTGIKPFACDECDKAFFSGSNLASHKRTHNGFKPYVCVQCDKRFPFSHTLVIHMRSHTGVKPYPCNQCERSFTSSSQLSQHIHRHTGLKPFSCDECVKKFSSTALLASHKRTHVRWKMRMYTCDVCKASFKERSNLGQHLLKYHLFL